MNRRTFFALFTTPFLACVFPHFYTPSSVCVVRIVQRRLDEAYATMRKLLDDPPKLHLYISTDESRDFTRSYYTYANVTMLDDGAAPPHP